ncbi:DUF1611 domain-containing protein [Thermodesulfobacteriota bacterium]
MEPTKKLNAVVYCEGAFNTSNGKTAHGLVRHTRRYNVVAILDSRHVGKDAGMVLDGKKAGMPIYADLENAARAASGSGKELTHFVIGLAPDGGRLPAPAKESVMKAIRMGMNIDSGLHDFLSEDPEIAELADEHDVWVRDVRKPPPRRKLHFFSGKISEVASLKVAVLGTDSAVGKRTTAWLLRDGLQALGLKSELIGTGQTAWLQGAEYCIILDSLINDFVAGEIEHAVWSAWHDKKPDAIVVEGQGSLLNPAYPGGFEILAAARPDVVVLQHAPARKEYDGFPGYPLHPLEKQIQAIELISGKPVVAVAVNHENIPPKSIPGACREITERTGLPACDVLVSGAADLVRAVVPYMQKRVA